MEEEQKPQQHILIDGMYENWFLDYASYVILERAIPSIEDGLKPVQRRILHAMKEMDDGRFNKVANVIGQTMQYHPHGDAAIGEAMVNMGQKDLLIETQGNWGDNRTGDSAAAARYIEARLSKFALEIAFNAQTTKWQLSYDGRKREPINLPMKFPLLLAQGVEGIAVGLSTKILPHNFCELIDASIKHLRGEDFELFPDFLTGGMIDVANYNEGAKGSKVRVRATIEELDKKTLIIKDVPYGVTTGSLMDSIVKANDNGKIKIKKVVDNTAKDVEIQVQLAPGVSPDITIDALYAFTDCEVSVSPNACVIIQDKPHFLSVKEILRTCTMQTRELLKWELEIKKAELEDKWHFSSLEKIFIENRIYRDIEECVTWEAVIEAIDSGLEPFKKLLRRIVTKDDIIRLTEIKIKRISKFDSFKADELIKALEAEMEQVAHHLANLTKYTIAYYNNLLKKYGAGRERKTIIKGFDTIEAANVAIANEKLYVNRTEGFVGFGIKKDEYVGDCSNLDDVLVIRKDGKFIVTKVSDKAFVGKNILHVAVWKKNDDRTAYNLLYLDGKSGYTYAKRFNISGITRDKEYDLTKGEANSKILYLTANPNSESEVVTVYLTPGSPAKKKVFDFDFAEIAIKGRGSQGNIACKYPIKRILFKSKGASSLGGRFIWFDETIGRINTDGRGRKLGSFDSGDLILTIKRDGAYELTDFELTNRYDPTKLFHIGKFKPQKPITAIHYNPGSKLHYVKRFLIETTTINKDFVFISEDKNAALLYASVADTPTIQLVTKSLKGEQETQEINLATLIEVKGWKALGNKLTDHKVISIIPIETEDEITEVEEEVVEAVTDSEDEPGTGGSNGTENQEITPGSTIVFKINKSDKPEEPGSQLSIF